MAILVLWMHLWHVPMSYKCSKAVKDVLDNSWVGGGNVPLGNQSWDQHVVGNFKVLPSCPRTVLSPKQQLQLIHGEEVTGTVIIVGDFFCPAY